MDAGTGAGVGVNGSERKGGGGGGGELAAELEKSVDRERETDGRMEGPSSINRNPEDLDLVDPSSRRKSKFSSSGTGAGAGTGTGTTKVKLSLLTKVGYGFGHVLNDLCASLWFTYLLFYLEHVVNLTHDLSAAILLLGQVVDGVSTPIIGCVQDRNMTCLRCKYGECKSWHLIGSVFVLLSFPFVFSPPIGGEGWSEEVKFGYIAPFVVIFQIGWAAAQVSHLALLPKMTPSQLARTELLAVRYGFTVASSLTIFTITWLILGISSTAKIDERHAYKFRNISLTAVGVGLVFVTLFHGLTREESTRDAATVSLAQKSDKEHFEEQRRLSGMRSSGEFEKEGKELAEKNGVKSWWPANALSTKYLSTRFQKRKLSIKDWLYLPQFYIVGLIYMATRISVNLTQVYMPIYLLDSLHLETRTVATVPLAMYVSGFLIALIIKPLNKYLGSQLSYTTGALMSVMGSVIMLLFDWQTNYFLREYGIYGVALLTGGGSSAILVTSLSITADLIGSHVENSAFVYGVMSFTDKLSCGLLVMLINSVLLPHHKKHNNNTITGVFYQNVLAIFCGGSALLGVLGVFILTLILCWEQRHPAEFFDANDEQEFRKRSSCLSSGTGTGPEEQPQIIPQRQRQRQEEAAAEVKK